MDKNDQFKSLLSEIIAKQAVILGSDIAILKARSVPGLEVANDGSVLNIKGDPKGIVERLVEEYVDLSGQIVKSALGSVFAKYPEIESKK